MEAFLMSSDTAELKKTDGVLNAPKIVTIHCAHPSWVKDGQVKGWEVIIEDKGRLEKVTTYDKSLTEHGQQKVEYYRNSVYVRCIRKAK